LASQLVRIHPPAFRENPFGAGIKLAEHGQRIERGRGRGDHARIDVN
jgi:hypothetical protein